MKKKVWNFDHQLLLTKSFPTTLKVCGIDAARETESIPQKKNTQKRFFPLKNKKEKRKSETQNLVFQTSAKKTPTFQSTHEWYVWNTGLDYIHTKASLELQYNEPWNMSQDNDA